MDPAEAAHLLGVAVDTPPDEVRTAFRRLIRRHHPDRSGDGGALSARLIEAHRVLRTIEPPPRPATPTPDPPAPTVGPPLDAHVEGDTLRVHADPATVVAALVEAGHELGEITYLDRAAGLVEVLLMVQGAHDDHPVACSVVASLQGRMDAIEVFCTVERLDGHPAPPVAPLVAALGAAMGARGTPPAP